MKRERPDDLDSPLWAIALASLGFWAIFTLLATTRAVVKSGEPFFATSIIFDGAMVLLSAAAGVAMRPALVRLARLPPAPQIAGASLMVVAIAAVFEFPVRTMFELMGGKNTVHLLTPKLMVVIALFWLAPFSLWTALNLAHIHQAEARRRERRLAALQAEAQAAQLRALRYQVNPHFLHNTLNAIATLIMDGRSDEAERLVLGLSRFFRASLASDPMQDVTLAEEVSLQRLYLDIERVRFDDFLSVEIDVPHGAGQALLPAMILQPLVENALKHGLRGPGRPMRLRLSARVADERLAVEVADDGQGSRAVGGGGGIGLRNVANRLAARFPGRASVDVNADAAGFRVTLSMPYEAAA